MTQSTALTAALSAMNTNVDVGMNEVVSVFVSKYEDGLFAKKDALSGDIRALKAELAQIDNSVAELVDLSEYATSVPALGFTFAADKAEVVWEGNYYSPKNTICIVLNMYDKSDRESAVYSKRINKAIPPSFIAKREEVKQALEEKNAELLEVMTLIKSVSRKERQIRGRISEMKLAESGFSGLLDNPEMLQLVAIK